MAGSVRLVTQASAVHVRTARLVAVTVARRAGFDEDVVESVRQGVGEACAMAVHGAEPGTRLELILDGSPRDLVVLVHPVPRAWSDGGGDLAHPVLTGLTGEIELTSTGRGDALRLHWRGCPRPGGAHRGRRFLPPARTRRYSPQDNVPCSSVPAVPAGRAKGRP